MGMLLKTKSILALAVVVALSVLALPALAAFVDGVERFDGAVPDTENWEFYTSKSGTVSQADVLTIDGTGDNGSNNDYTTKTQTLAVGQAVSVEATFNVTGPWGAIALMLTNNSSGTGTRTLDDTHLYGIYMGNGSNITLAYRVDSGGEAATQIGSVRGQPVGSTRIYRLDRETATSIKLTVYDAEGVELGSDTITTEEFASDPYISLVSGSASTTFDNVRIMNAGDPQPLPAVNAPTFSPDSGAPPLTVTVSCVTPGVTIRYTTDGTDPSETNGTIIASGGTIAVNQELVLKARAFKDGKASIIKTAAYSFPYFPNDVERFNGTVLNIAKWEPYLGGSGSITQNGALTISGLAINADCTTKVIAVPVGKAVSVDATLVATGSGAIAFMLTNNSGGAGSRTLDDTHWYGIYMGTGHGATYAYSKDSNGEIPIQIGDMGIQFEGETWIYRLDRLTETSIKCTVYDSSGVELGTETLTMEDFETGPYISLIVSGTTTIFDNVRIMNAGDPQPLPILVSFDPDGGTFPTAQPVTITCDAPGATIRYTTDGTDPSETNGTVISSGGTATVSSHFATLKAKAWAGGEDSVIKTSHYIIEDGLDRPTTIPAGTATIDGDLSDWASAQWAPMDRNYNANPLDIAEAYYTARWQPNKIYVAVKVRDTAHKFLDAYTSWDARDAVELYIHSTGTSSDGSYDAFYDVAQQYAVGVTDTDRTAVWSTFGSGAALTSSVGLEAAGREVGEWIYYEVAMIPFEFFGELFSPTQPNIVPTLAVDQLIGLDVTAVGHDGTKYTGMKAENLVANKWGWYAYFGQHKLVMGPLGNIADAKTASNGSGAGFSGIVTGVFGEYFYVEDPDRVYGICVKKTGHGLSVGQSVSGSGTVNTLGSGERYIDAGSVSASGTGQIAPLEMTNKALGGGDFGTPPNGQVGAAGGAGLNTIGLLVKTTGKVGTKGAGWFMIDDGSGVGVKVIGTVPAATPYVSVTGVSSLEAGGVRVIKARTSTDIKEFAP